MVSGKFLGYFAGHKFHTSWRDFELVGKCIGYWYFWRKVACVLVVRDLGWGQVISYDLQVLRISLTVAAIHDHAINECMMGGNVAMPVEPTALV